MTVNGAGSSFSNGTQLLVGSAIPSSISVTNSASFLVQHSTFTSTVAGDNVSLTVGSNAVANPQSFVSGTGDVRIRYTFKPQADGGVTGITFTRLDVNATGLMR